MRCRRSFPAYEERLLNGENGRQVHWRTRSFKDNTNLSITKESPKLGQLTEENRHLSLCQCVCCL